MQFTNILSYRVNGYVACENPYEPKTKVENKTVEICIELKYLHSKL